MDALIADCGFAFNGTSTYPDCGGFYHYAAESCDYKCLAVEYTFWAVRPTPAPTSGCIPAQRLDNLCGRLGLAQSPPAKSQNVSWLTVEILVCEYQLTAAAYILWRTPMEPGGPGFTETHQGPGGGARR